MSELSEKISSDLADAMRQKNEPKKPNQIIHPKPIKIH